MNSAAKLMARKSTLRDIKYEISKLEDELTTLEWYDYKDYDHTYVDFIDGNDVHIRRGRYNNVDPDDEELDYEDAVISLLDLATMI